MQDINTQQNGSELVTIEQAWIELFEAVKSRDEKRLNWKYWKLYRLLHPEYKSKYNK